MMRRTFCGTIKAGKITVDVDRPAAAVGRLAEIAGGSKRPTLDTSRPEAKEDTTEPEGAA